MQHFTSTRPHIKRLQAREQRRKRLINAVAMFGSGIAISIIASIVYIVLVIATV